MSIATVVLMLGMSISTLCVPFGAAALPHAVSAAEDTVSPVTAKQWFALGQSLYGERRYREAVAAFERGVQLDADGAPIGAWNIARSYARLGNGKQALRWLAHARDYGFRDAHAMLDDAAFDRFRKDLCHPERSEGSASSPTRKRALRCAQRDSAVMAPYDIAHRRCREHLAELLRCHLISRFSLKSAT